MQPLFLGCSHYYSHSYDKLHTPNNIFSLVSVADHPCDHLIWWSSGTSNNLTSHHTTHDWLK